MEIHNTDANEYNAFRIFSAKVCILVNSRAAFSSGHVRDL